MLHRNEIVPLPRRTVDNLDASFVPVSPLRRQIPAVEDELLVSRQGVSADVANGSGFPAVDSEALQGNGIPKRIRQLFGTERDSIVVENNSGSISNSRLEQLVKADAPMLVTEFGTTI